LVASGTPAAAATLTPSSSLPVKREFERFFVNIFRRCHAMNTKSKGQLASTTMAPQE
jgi:hypothetical protein